ncbi:MAG: hypothetical protein PVF34_12470 [Gammaproteobacteria bacterium]|jgi:hypothetical protein
MKKMLIFILMLNGCAARAAENDRPPNGEELFDILFSNTGLSLKGEPRCNVKSMTRENTDITLGQHLATIMSLSHESDNRVTLASACSLSKDDSSGKVVDVWDCKLEMNESDKAGTFISSAMVAFYLSLDKTKLINGSIRCL